MDTKSRSGSSSYRADLAWIHHVGFSELIESASVDLLELLGHRKGLVIDVGCGSGIWARELTRAGFQVLGIDPSPAMIDIARAVAPKARFVVETFDRAELPPCAAITAVGEVLNYGTLESVRTFFSNAAGALAPKGLLVFDIAERESYPAHDERRAGGDDWSVIVIKDSDGTRLTRRVMTFRPGSRDEETHELELYDRHDILRLLRDEGFRVRVRRSYGSWRLPRGYAVYIAVKR